MTNHVIVLPSTVLLSLCAADGQVWKLYLRWHAWRLAVSVVHNFKEHGPQNWTLKLLKWWIQLRGFPRLLQINDGSSDKSRRNRHAQDLHEDLRHNFFFHCVMTPNRKSEQTVVSVLLVERTWREYQTTILIPSPRSTFLRDAAVADEFSFDTCLTFSSLHLGNLPNK